ncbi:MAG: oxygenase MpaB family protein [Solirubrobacteraceae bacterium]
MQASHAGRLFPGDDEIDGLIVGPQSVTWQFTSDVRLLLAPLYALLLQVAHPTVAAGVWDHSDFERRPWDRLMHTFDFLLVLQYGGPEAVAAGRRVRELHEGIEGVRADGQHYRALDRGAYAWVHSTLIETYVRAHQHFGRPMTREQSERFYQEFVGLGRLVGVREDDLPSSWSGFRTYFDHMAAHELGPNETVDHVLAAVRKPASPGLRFVPELLWRVLRLPPTRLAYLGGVGLMPASLRERLQVGWNRRDEVEFRLIAASSRALDPVLPAALKTLGPTELRWRRREIARHSSTRRSA